MRNRSAYPICPAAPVTATLIGVFMMELATNAHALDDRDSLQKPRRLYTAGNSRYSERFRDAHCGNGAGPHPQSDGLLRPHTHQKHLQSVAGPAAHGAGGVAEQKEVGLLA